LLRGPLGCRVFGDAIVKNSPGGQFHHDEYIKDVEPGRNRGRKSQAMIAWAWFRREVNQR
jgi:hypothetical protein